MRTCLQSLKALLIQSIMTSTNLYPQQSPPRAQVDNLAASLPCKTPVSLLQELCMRRGISPKYDLLQIEGAVHEPTFVYRVTVGEFTASGSGQSKKKAKHAAAKAVLDIIIHGGGPVPAPGGGEGAENAATSPVVHGNGSDAATTAAQRSTMIVTPYDDGIPGNPVGQLQELSMTRRWPPPTYELVSEDGFPHERTFSMACTIATHKEVGTGKSKKLAKRQAAHNMLQKLSDLPQDQSAGYNMNEDEDDLAQRLTMRYSGIKDAKLMTLSSGEQRKVSQFHMNLKDNPGANIKKLQKLMLSNPSLNFVKLLQDIATESNFSVTYVDIEEKSITGELQCLLQLSTLPVAVCYGTGATSEQAQSSAAYNALEYLKIMTKSTKERK